MDYSVKLYYICMYLLVNECFVYIIFPYEYNYSIENLIARFSLFYLYMVDWEWMKCALHPFSAALTPVVWRIRSADTLFLCYIVSSNIV